MAGNGMVEARERHAMCESAFRDFRIYDVAIYKKYVPIRCPKMVVISFVKLKRVTI
jgi:hypothetical protein